VLRLRGGAVWDQCIIIYIWVIKLLKSHKSLFIYKFYQYIILTLLWINQSYLSD
jgi:hypothetical protein